MLRLGEGIGSVKVDPGQLEQVLLNLAVNARHAMLRGGTLTLATDTGSPDHLPGEAPSGPDDHVRLTVTDTGVGMDPEALKAKAIRKGLLTQTQADELSDLDAGGVSIEGLPPLPDATRIESLELIVRVRNATD